MVVILKCCFVQIFNFHLYKIKNMYFHKIKKLYSSVYIDFLLILLKIKIFVY